MTLDLEMAEIAKVFFQESREGLDLMESGLLSLGATADSESINTIFRAAHSIKGGSATFGFSEVAGFTHGVETLLDEMRNGVRPVTAEAIQVLLQACDCLRDMIAATEAEQPLDQGRIANLNGDIAHILGERPPPASAPAAGRTDRCRRGIPEPSGWRIVFEPVADLLRLRNEPTRMFAELARLGTFTARADISRVPALGALDPESCYLSWDIEMSGRISRSKLDEVFDWVDSRCRLEFTPKVGSARRRAGGADGRASSRARPALPRRKKAARNPARSASPPKSSTTSSIWSASCSSHNRCSAASPTASIRTNWTGCARGFRSWRATRASCRRA